MKVSAVEGNQKRQGLFIPTVGGAAIGAAAGYVGKYALPLTYEEKNSDEYIKVSNKIAKEKAQYNFRTDKFVSSLKAKEQRTAAEEAFVKMFDGLKEGDTVKQSSIRNAIKELTEKYPNQVVAFKRLCKATSEIAEKTAKQCMNAYDFNTKHLRPTGFFLVAGAIVGGFIALASNILKTEVKPSFN
jgi:hypothetical protein